MKTIMCLAAGLLLAGCDDVQQAAADGAPSNLPKPGRYEVTRITEFHGSMEPAKEEKSERCLTPSNMEEFASTFGGKPVGLSGCHDIEADTGDGRFEMKMLCDAPDGDINNIPSEMHGTYSPEEFEIVEQITIYGTVQRSTKRYQRLGDC